MNRESSRRWGAVNFDKSQVGELADHTQGKELFRSLLENALKDAEMKWTDDFSFRLVVTENFPEDQS